jgi:F-type H+-transporting ATPase subunit gamma
VELEGKKQLVMLVTSDKGLCGALNSVLVRPLQMELRNNRENIDVACIGGKGRNGLVTGYKENILMHVLGFGKTPVTFMEVIFFSFLFFSFFSSSFSRWRTLPTLS